MSEVAHPVGTVVFSQMAHFVPNRCHYPISAQRGLLSEGLSGEVGVGVRCFSFHEVELRALSEGLDIRMISLYGLTI
jgi:hypothetical protein